MDTIKNLSNALLIFAKYSNDLQNICFSVNIMYVVIPIKNVYEFPENLVEDKDKDKLFTISGSDAKHFDDFDIRMLYHYGFVYNFDDEYWYIEI